MTNWTSRACRRSFKYKYPGAILFRRREWARHLLRPESGCRGVIQENLHVGMALQK